MSRASGHPSTIIRPQPKTIMFKKTLLSLAFAAASPLLLAEEVKVDISGNDQMQFDKKTFEVVE